MLETLRKTIYASIGASVVTAEKVESALSDLVEKGKMSAEDARSVADKISEDSKKEFEDSREAIQKSFEEFLQKSPVVSKKDFDALQLRVEALEKLVVESDNS